MLKTPDLQEKRGGRGGGGGSFVPMKEGSLDNRKGAYDPPPHTHTQDKKEKRGKEGEGRQSQGLSEASH